MYLLQLTEIGCCKYAALSWLGLLPNQLLYAALGTSLRALEAQVSKPQPALRYSVFAIEVRTCFSHFQTASSLEILCFLFYADRRHGIHHHNYLPNCAQRAESNRAAALNGI